MKTLSITAAALASSALAAIVSLFVGLAVLGVAGADYFAVASDSMVPVMERGDLVITGSRGALNIGDAVTFSKYQQLVTHRIVANGKQPGTYETRGDANVANDPWTITARDVVGKVHGVVTNAGWPLLLMSAAGGRLTFFGVVIGAVLLLLWSWPRAVYSTQAVP